VPVGALTGPDLSLSARDLLQDLHLTGRSSESLDGPTLRTAIAEIVDGVSEGRLRAPAIERFTMANAAAAQRAMQRGELRGRALLVP
jgi:NADPH2:quinone reductase